MHPLQRPSDARVIPASAFMHAGAPSLQHFLGVDASSAAVDLARQPGRFPASASVEFAARDMLEHVSECTQTFDIVMSSFAVHHLATTAKAELLKQVHRCLKPGAPWAFAEMSQCRALLAACRNDQGFGSVCMLAAPLPVCEAGTKVHLAVHAPPPVRHLHICIPTPA